MSSLCRPRGDNDELLAEFDMAEIWVCAAVQLEEAEFWEDASHDRQKSRAGVRRRHWCPRKHPWQVESRTKSPIVRYAGAQDTRMSRSGFCCPPIVWCPKGHLFFGSLGFFVKVDW